MPTIGLRGSRRGPTVFADGGKIATAIGHGRMGGLKFASVTRLRTKMPEPKSTQMEWAAERRNAAVETLGHWERGSKMPKRYHAAQNR